MFLIFTKIFTVAAVINESDFSDGQFSLFVCDDVVYVNVYFKLYSLRAKFVEFVTKYAFCKDFTQILVIDADELKQIFGHVLPVLSLIKSLLQFKCNAHPFRHAIVVDDFSLHSTLLRLIHKYFTPAVS